MSADPLSPRARWWPPALAWSLLALVLVAGVDSSWTLALNRLGTLTGDWPWVELTSLGNGAVLVALLAPWLVRRPEALRAALVSALVVTLVTRLGKELVDAPRPVHALGRDALHVIGPVLKRHAFPSGHTAAAFTMAGIVWLAGGRRGLRVTIVVLALGVALSRVVVGAHWPRDVLAGAGLGWLLAQASWWLAGRWSSGLSRGVQLAAVLLIVGLSLKLPFDDAGFDAPPLVHGLAALSGTLGVVGALTWRRRSYGASSPPDAINTSAVSRGAGAVL